MIATESTYVRNGHAARSEASRAHLVDAWCELEQSREPTVEAIIAVANLSRASFYRLTSMSELALLGGEQILVGSGITTVEEIDRYLTALWDSIADEVTDAARRPKAAQVWVERIRTTLRRIDTVAAVRTLWERRP